jgi:hypothetical protein
MTTIWKTAQEMEDVFNEFNYSPELEILGAGCFVFVFHDLPNNQRLGINDECVVLYSSDPDCDGIWSYYFPDNMTTAQKVLNSTAIFDLLRLEMFGGK